MMSIFLKNYPFLLDEKGLEEDKVKEKEGRVMGNRNQY